MSSVLCAFCNLNIKINLFVNFKELILIIFNFDLVLFFCCKGCQLEGNKSFDLGDRAARLRTEEEKEKEKRKKRKSEGKKSLLETRSAPLCVNNSVSEI